MAVIIHIAGGKAFYHTIRYLKLTVDKTQKTLFQCLTEGFRYFGDVPKELLFDNMSTVVDRSKTTFKNVSINQKFKYFSRQKE